MSAHRTGFGQLQLGAMLFAGAALDGWTALQTRDLAALAGASTSFRLAMEFCFPNLEWLRIRGFDSGPSRSCQFAGR
ncbi:MAG: hypothetical protein ACREHF_01835 [Rhizomicrobium sp.]